MCEWVVHEKMKSVKLGHLSFYGFLHQHCDISNYEEYSIIELMEEFCEIVPCFFYSYEHLHLLFKHRFHEVDKALLQLRADLLFPPSAPLQAKLACIIHMYYLSLPW